MPWLDILTGLLVLLLGAELLVRGSAWLAEAMGIRPMIVGLTVVAIGTSAPELVVSLKFAAKGDFADSLGNVFGSNTANIALILGTSALVMPITMRAGARIRFELAFLLAASAATLVPLLTGSYNRAFGIAMIAGLCSFVWLLIERERRSRPPRDPATIPPRTAPQIAAHIIMVPAGLLGLIYGGEWLVDGAKAVARSFGLSDGVIGATVVAIGTSLPELATSVVAARKGHSEMALGNVIGSNVFNILMVLGCTATVYGLPVSAAEQTLRTVVAFGLTIVMAVFLLGPKRIGRIAGTSLLAIYAVYVLLEVSQL